MSGIGALMSGDVMQGGWAMLATLGAGAAIAVLVATLAALPLMMACWFAPALVMLRHDEPVAAMKTSFFACLANVLPMLVYGLIGIVLAHRRVHSLRPRLARAGSGICGQCLRELQGHLRRARNNRKLRRTARGREGPQRAPR